MCTTPAQKIKAYTNTNPFLNRERFMFMCHTDTTLNYVQFKM